MASESMTFNLLAKDRASRVFDRVGKSVDRTEGHFSGLGRTMAKVGRVAALGLAAGVGLGALALKDMVGEARESQRVGRLTTAVIKSTGGAAKVSAKQVGELSTAISNKTGIDDEAIQTGSNLLLTFKNVRNEVGKGNKIFNEATQAAVDLSAAGFGSIESASKSMGKALNDPVKGITALGRAGVTFSADQQEQIKNFVKTGDLLAAQKIILGEVQSQVGGAAAATATPMEKLKVTVDNLKESMGTALLPVIDRVATFLVAHLPGAVATAQSKITAFIGGVREIVDKVVGFYRDAKPRIQAVFDAFVPNVQALIAGIKAKFATVGGGLIASIQEGLATGNWAMLGATIGEGLSKALEGGVKAGAALSRAFAGVDWFALGKKASAVAVPFIIGFVNDLMVNFIKFVKNNPVDALVFVTSFIPIGRVAGVLEKVLGRLPFLGPLLRGISSTGGAVEKAFGAVWRGIVRALEFVAPSAVAAVRRLADRIVFRIFSLAVDAGAAALKAGKSILRGLLGPFAGIADRLFSAGAGLIGGFVRGIVSKVGAVKGTLENLTSKLTSWKGPPDKDRTLLIPAGRALMDGLNQGIVEGSKKIRETLQTLTQNVADKVGELKSSARDMVRSVADSVRGVVDVGAFGAPVDTGTVDAEGNAITRTPGVAETASGFASQAKAFVTALQAMAAKKLAPSLIAAVAAAGPVGGLQAAQAFASSSAGDVASVNASIGAIDALAKQAGNTVLKTTRLPADIKREEAMLAELKGLRADLTGESVVKSLRITKGGDLIVEYVNESNRQNRRRG